MLDKQKILTTLCEELKERPIAQYAVKKAGISRSQFYRWMKEDPDFAQKITEAIQEGNAVVNDFTVSKLLTGINNDNLSAVFFWLRHRHPDFSNKLEITAKQEITHTLTDEEKDIIKEALLLSGLSDAERKNLDNILKNDNYEKF